MEYWDIYDEKKERTGRTMARNDWHMKPGDYHLTVLALIINETGRILLTQRQLDKQWAPGKWEIPAAVSRQAKRLLKRSFGKRGKKRALCRIKRRSVLSIHIAMIPQKNRTTTLSTFMKCAFPLRNRRSRSKKRRSRGLPFLTLKRSGSLAKEGKSSIMPILRIYFRRRPQPCLKMSFYCFFPASFRQCLYRGSHFSRSFCRAPDL